MKSLAQLAKVPQSQLAKVPKGSAKADTLTVMEEQGRTPDIYIVDGFSHQTDNNASNNKQSKRATATSVRLAHKHSKEFTIHPIDLHNLLQNGLNLESF